MFKTTALRRGSHSISKMKFPNIPDFRWPYPEFFPDCPLHIHKSWLTPTDRATRRVTPSRHRAVHKAGHWVWSTGNGRRSTVDNTWRRSTCRREIIFFLFLTVLLVFSGHLPPLISYKSPVPTLFSVPALSIQLLKVFGTLWLILFIRYTPLFQAAKHK